jgi:hypothetical protein
VQEGRWYGDDGDEAREDGEPVEHGGASNKHAVEHKVAQAQLDRLRSCVSLPPSQASADPLEGHKTTSIRKSGAREEMVLLSSSIKPSPRSVLPIMFSVLIISGTTKPIPHTTHTSMSITTRCGAAQLSRKQFSVPL